MKRSDFIKSLGVLPAAFVLPAFLKSKKEPGVILWKHSDGTEMLRNETGNTLWAKRVVGYERLQLEKKYNEKRRVENKTEGK